MKNQEKFDVLAQVCLEILTKALNEIGDPTLALLASRYGEFTYAEIEEILASRSKADILIRVSEKRTEEELDNEDENS